jgi:hypothetical protein
VALRRRRRAWRRRASRRRAMRRRAMRRGDRVEDEGDVAVEGCGRRARRREPGLFRPHSHSPPESPGQRDMSPWRVVRRPPCSRTRLCVRLACAFELSAQARRRSEYLTPAACTSTTCKRSATLAHPSSTLPVAASACAIRQGRARASPPAAPPWGRQDAQARRSNGGRRRAPSK